jgi:hypothetical protein
MPIEISSGGCYCGNISFEIETSKSITEYQPRACDCDFCTKHGAAYLSDKSGHFKVRVRSESDLGRYKQGSGIADFLVCKNCGVLIGVCYTEDGKMFGTINARALSHKSTLQKSVPASPKQLLEIERIARWKEIWFSNVQIEIDNA